MSEAEISFCVGYPAAAHNTRPMAQSRHASSTPARRELAIALYRSIFGIKCGLQVRVGSEVLMLLPILFRTLLSPFLEVQHAILVFQWLLRQRPRALRA